MTCDMAVRIICSALSKGGKLFTCGNGGSASDSEHICSELAKGFLLQRPLDADIEQKIAEAIPCLSGKLQKGLAVFSLTSESALISAIVNDIDGVGIFAQQLLAKSTKGDVLLALSTSGTSENIIAALKVAKVIGLKTILLTGPISRVEPDIADVIVSSDNQRVDKIQEDHIKYYHYICAEVEKFFFK